MRAATLLLCTALSARSAEHLDLCGVIDPAPPRATVTLRATADSFRAHTRASRDGRFRFKALEPGEYIVSVAAPGAHYTERSFDVTPGLASAAGCVPAAIPFAPATLTGRPIPRTRSTVSVTELGISDQARKEYIAARKDRLKNNLASAERHLQRAVELAPQYTMAWHDLGSIAASRERFTEAETFLRRALATRPNAVLPALSLGGVLLYLHRPGDALPYNQQAVDRWPTNPLANYQLGVNYVMLGDDGQAFKFLTAARNLDPSSLVYPQLALAELHGRRGERAEMLRELEDFIARHPDAPQAARVKGQMAGLRK